MAIIYSYPTVTPERTDLILGTDVSVPGKPTKNFTIQSVIDLVTIATGDLQFVLDLGFTAIGKDINLTNNTFRGGGFVTTSGGTITGTTASGFTNVTSTAFTGTIATPAQPNITSLGTLSALVISGPISGTGLITNSNLTGAQNDNVVSTLAIKTYVDNKVGLYDTLAEVLGQGNVTGGTDIVVSAGDDVTFTNTSKILMGTTPADNLEIYSDSANSIVIDRSPGALKLQTSLLSVRNEADTTQTISATAAGGVELYHVGAKKIETLTGGAKVTGAFEATTSGTFASLINTGSYSDSSGDIGTAGQILSSTGSGTNWVTEVPLYNWSLEGTAIPSGTAVTVTDGTNITTTWDATNFDLTIATTGVPDGSGAANQVTYWSDTDTLTGAAGFTFAGGATGKVAIAGELEVGGVLTDGTFTGSAGAYTGYTSITSTDFVGALTGNASTATALASSGAIALTGDTASTGGPYTYTSGGALSIATTIADTTVTGKVLTNLATPTSSAIAATDTILAAMAKLQGQITGLAGSLAFEGTWDASAGTAPSGTPLNGQFWIVSVAGNTDLSGITDWLVGDWAIYVDNGAGTDAWQKLDQSNEVLGSGAANKIAKWTSTNTLATGLIDDDGTTVTVGNSGNFIVEGNTTLGDADTDSTTVKGPAVFEETLRINEGISLGAATYGTAGQVLTSGGGSASVNTWTTPTTGTVTSVTAGTGITIGGTAADPTVAIDYLGTDNAILSAPQENGIATTDTVWFSDATDDNIKKTTVANLIALDGARSLSATLAIGNTSGANNILMADSQSVDFGAGNDLTIQHDGTNSLIFNNTGHLILRNSADDKDIVFQSDDGGGGVAEYFKVDGSLLQTVFSKPTRHVDGMAASFGNSYDLNIYHTGTDSFIDNNTGNLNFRSFATDKDIIFQSDDGSGGVTEYLRLDGSAEEIYFSKSTLLFDNVKAKFGNGSDLQIYHDGSNSYIKDVGTGSLNLQAADDVFIRPQGGQDGIKVIGNSGVELYGYNLGTSAMNKAFYISDLGNGSVRSVAEKGLSIKNGSNGYGLLQYSTQGAGSNRGGIEIYGGNESYGKRMFIGSAYIQGTTSSSPGFGLSPVVEFFPTNNPETSIASYQFTNTRAFMPSLKVGNTEITGNLTVDGHIIHGGGGGGTGKGGQFTKLYTTGNAGVAGVAFTIDRASSGSMVFDVMLTSDNSNSVSIAKKFTVASRLGTQAPIFNKTIDTGPDGSNDFTAVFAADGTSNTKIKCTITPAGMNTQKIGVTIDLGFGQNDATVVMN